MRNSTTPSQKPGFVALESFILDGIFQSQALGRLCDVGWGEKKEDYNKKRVEEKQED